MAREDWRVYVVRPRPGGREGRNYTLCAEPPASLKRAGVKPIRKTAETDDHAEAERRAEKMARDLNSSVLDGEDPTVIEVLAKHTDWRAATGAPANTIMAYRSALRRLTPLLGEARGRDLSRALLRRAQDALLKVPLAPGTVNQTLNCAGAAWVWAVERERATVDGPRAKRPHVPETQKRPFTDAEVESVLGWLATYRGGYWLPLFAVLADSGARVGELLRLRGSQVDREACVLRLGRGKNRETRSPRLPRDTMALVPAAEPNHLVFRPKRPGFRGDRPMSARNTLGVLWRALDALKIPDADNLDHHSFRRSWISASVDERVPLTASMAVVGHRSTKVHLDYARRAERDMAVAVDTVRERRRRAAGLRPWEATAEDTAEHRRRVEALDAPNSSASPPGSPARASC
ncbi:MAG: site-specific integrase [Planctomycetota bacterium]|nr:site-specific integrase [Planctomycetota bacterium]